MNKTTASLSKGFLSVFLMLSLVLPSIAIPLEALALEGAAGGNADGSQYGGGGGEGTGTGQGEPDSDGDGASDSAEGAASAAAAESVAAAASVAGVEVGVAAVDTTKDANAVAGMVSVDGVTMSVDAAMAAIGAIADAQAQGLNPSANSSVPGIDVAATLSANAMGELGSVVGSMTAETGDAKSVAAAETGAAIGQQAGLQALGLAAGINGMNPASAPATNANAALAAAAAHPAMLSPVSLVSSLPVGFTFAPVTSNVIAPNPVGGKWGGNQFSPQNKSLDATNFSLANAVPSTSLSPNGKNQPGFSPPTPPAAEPLSYTPTTANDTAKNQYAQYALGMEIGRMATQKSLAESKYAALAENPSFNPAMQSMLDAAQAEVDAWSATIDARVDPTTQNQAVATLSQSKANELGKLAAEFADPQNANDPSKAGQLSQAISAIATSYDNQIADAKSSAAAAQKSLDDANASAKAVFSNMVAVDPLGTLSKPDSISSVTDWGNVVADSFVDMGLDPEAALAATQVTAVVADIASFGVLGIAANLADSYEYSSAAANTTDADSKAALSAQADQSFAQAVTGAATAVAGIGIANGFVGAVSAGIGKSAAFGIGNAASKSATTAAPATASVAGKTAAKSAGQTIDVSFNPATKSVTFSAPAAPAAVAEGRIAGTAAKSADNVATPSSLAGKATDDVATPSSAASGKAPASTPSSLAGKAADDVAAPSSPTSGKAPTAANDNVPANTPANANSLGSRSATTPTSVATKADDVAAPVSTPASAATPTVAPAVPGVTIADALVGPQAAPTSLAGRLSLSTSKLADTLGIPASVAPASASVASRSTSAALAVAQALSAPVSPAALAKSLAGITDDFSKAISRNADDLAVPSQNSISSSLKSLDNTTTPAPTTGAAKSSGTAAKSTAPTNATTPVVAPVNIAPTTVQTTPVTQVAAQPTTPAQTTAPTANQTAPATVQANPSTPTAAQPAATNPVAAAQTFAPADLGKYTVAPAVQATPATEVALGLKSLGEPTTQMTKDAAAAGFTIESPQQAVAIGIAHEVSPQTRDAIVDAYTRDGNFDSLPDSIIAEPAAFINAIANEAAGKNRSVVQQVAAKKYLSSVTVDKKAYDTMANPQTRAALTELAKQLTNGIIAAERGLDVAAPARTANHFYASYINPSWAKSLIDVVKVGDYTKTVTGLAPKETNPVKQGVKSVLDRVDQATLFSPDSLESLPTPAQTVLAFADKLSKSTPASLALEVQAGAAGRLAQALPKAAEPAVTNPAAQTQAPAQTSPAQDSVITKDSTDAQVQAYWAAKNPRGANLSKVNPKLLKAAAMGAQTFEALNPQYQVEVQGPASGFRGGGKTKNHTVQPDGYGGALDVVIFDKVTNHRLTNYTVLKYRGQVPLGQAMPVYQQWFNEVAIAAYHMDPQLAKTLRHGGYFGGKYAADAMHVDVRGNVIGTTGGTTLGGFTDAQMKTFGISQNNPLKSWDNVKTLADDRYNNPNQSVAPTVATPVQTAPEVTTAVPTSRPDTVPATVSPSTPISPIPAQVVTPSAPTPSTVSGSPTANTNTVAPDSNTLGSPSTPGQGDTAVSPTTNAGVPPDYQSTGGTGPGRGTGLTNAVLSPIYAFFAAIAIGIDALLGSDDEDIDAAESTTALDTVGSDTNNDDGSTSDGSSVNGGRGTTQTPTTPSDSLADRKAIEAYYERLLDNATSSNYTNHVLMQVDGNTGNLHFSLAGFQHDGKYYDLSDAEDEGDLLEEATAPSIVLDDQRLNILYSDGTYAPVVIDGVWYESADDPNYVYTVEYYLDGELVAAADNAGVLPEGNPLTNLLGNLFSSSDEYGLEDVDTITRALVDPDEQVPADEYYIYRVYLNGGGTRSTTVPRYTSYRFMSERFAETGFTGNVTALIAESIEVPPPSRGGVSAIVDTFKKIGLAVVDIFRDDEAENPVVTDFGNLTPSDDGEITMADIRNVTVLLDVEAECPLAPGLDRPYLYEIVIAQAAISGATTDQAFRAVRCGGGDKADFVEQIAAHFETFDGVGTIDRQAMSDMIRFALFKDLDLSFLLENDEPGESTATSTPATVPDGEDQEYVPNLTNDVVFEVKAEGSQGQTLLDWSVANEIRIGSTVQLYFRWDGSDYEQCLPFLNDNGIYALKASGSAMTTGNTESEGYDVPEANTTYRIECGGQRNNEFGVDDRSIKVIIE